MLHELAGLKSLKENHPQAAQAQLVFSTFFRALHKNVMCRPFSSFQECLPLSEKVILMARYLDSNYLLLRYIAYLLATLDVFFQQGEITLSRPNVMDSPLKIPDSLLSLADYSQFDCTLEERNAFIYRISRLNALLTKALPLNDETFLNTVQLPWKYWFGEETIHPHLLHIAVILWSFIQIKIDALNLQPTPQQLQIQSDAFRIKHHLHSKEATLTWLTNHGLSLNDYQSAIKMMCNFSHLVINNNMDVFNLPVVSTNIGWLKDALWLSGLYHEAKELLSNQSKLTFIKNELSKKQKDLHQYALAMDFLSGEAELFSTAST